MLNLARSGADEPLAEAFPSLSKARLWPLGLWALSLITLAEGTGGLCLVHAASQSPEHSPKHICPPCQVGCNSPLGVNNR